MSPRQSPSSAIYLAISWDGLGPLLDAGFFMVSPLAASVCFSRCLPRQFVPTAPSMRLPSTRKLRSRRETFAERNEQIRRTLDADAAADQRPEQASFFGEEAEPRLAVGGHTQVGRALMAVLHLQRAAPNRHG